MSTFVDPGATVAVAEVQPLDFAAGTDRESLGVETGVVPAARFGLVVAVEVDPLLQPTTVTPSTIDATTQFRNRMLPPTTDRKRQARGSLAAGRLRRVGRT
jgi:hypothetical protein